MKVVRDHSWQVLYKDAQTSGRDETVCVTVANSIWRYNVKAREMKEERAKRSILVVNQKKQTSNAPKHAKLCQGETKSGQPCRFKASCHGYCKKHTM